VRLQENNNEREKTLGNKKTKSKQNKKNSKAKEEIEIKIDSNGNSIDESSKKTTQIKEVAFLENKEEIEPTNANEENTARKKRRRSSASIE